MMLNSLPAQRAFSHLITNSIIVFIALFDAVPCLHGQHQESVQSTLQSMAEVKARVRDPNDALIPVDLEATVNYWNPARRKLFVEDNGSAIYVRLPNESFDTAPNFRSGSRVRIVGNFLTRVCLIKSDNVRILGDVAQVKPRKIEIDELPRGSHWSNRVKCEGIVECVVRSGDLTQLIVGSNGHAIVCFVNGDVNTKESLALVGSKVRVTGVMDWSTPTFGVPEMALCQVMDIEDVKVLTHASESRKPRQLESLESISMIENGTPIMVSGIVSYVASGKSFLVEDPAGALLVKYIGTEMIESGLTVDLQGELNEGTGGKFLTLSHAQESSDSIEPLEVLKTDALEIVDTQVNHCRVTLVGELKQYSSRENARELILNQNGLVFQVKFAAEDQEFAQLKLHTGQQVQCQGIVLQESDNAWFTIHVDSVKQIWPQSQDGIHIDRSEAKWWLAGFSSFVAIVFGWLSTLRVQVHRKTQHLAGLSARLDASNEVIDEGVVVVGSDGLVTSVNSRFRAMVGADVSAGVEASVLWKLLDCRFRNSTDLTFSQHNAFSESSEFELRTTTEPHLTLEAFFAPVHDKKGVEIARLLTLKDTTKQKELEAQLVQSQKMEAVGQLAGGVAHDFNNLLMVIVSNLEMATLEISEGDVELAENLAAAELAADRATELVKGLLGFSRLSSLELRTTLLNEVVESVSSLLRHSFESTIRIVTDLEADLWNTKVDPSQIEQVLMNVCVNARDALPNHSGTIVISTANVVKENGQAVVLRVVDDGEGMSESTRRRVFDPFFTTKPTGEGTGLGMSMSYGIVTQHQGRISCVSAPDMGTSIEIVLPRCYDEFERKEDSEVAPSASIKLEARVLLVDDEEAVRRSTTRMLNAIGLAVTDVDNGQDALTIAQEQQFDLVVLDLNMPELSGRDVFRQLSREHPALPVVIYTGYLTDVESFSADSGGEPAALLRKPFRRSELKSVIADVLATIA